MTTDDLTNWLVGHAYNPETGTFHQRFASYQDRIDFRVLTLITGLKMLEQAKRERAQMGGAA